MDIPWADNPCCDPTDHGFNGRNKVYEGRCLQSGNRTETGRWKRYLDLRRGEHNSAPDKGKQD